MDINKVFIIGRLTKEPELKYTNSGTSYCKFGVALNETRKEQEKTHFINCLVWSKTAEVIAQYCKKGHRIGIDGRLSQSTWQDKDGNNRSNIEVIVENFQFLEKK